ncbi:MAG: SCO family protein [Proteobacteria bacterium]|nr:SCO family protein [Pseudomonadota bacterium]
MNRPLVALCALAALAALPLAAPAVEPAHHHEHAAPAAGPLPGGSLYQLGATLDGSGGPLPLASLRGAPVVVTMFYSSCTTVCPMLTLAMQRTALALSEPERAQVRFLMVSLDAARDTPARLVEFAQSHHLAAPAFVVAHASAEDVRTIAAALGIRYRQLPDGSFSHSSVITLLDRDGVAVARTQALSAEDPAFVERVRAQLK